MFTFTVKITTQDGTQHDYTAIGSHSFDVWDAAITTYGMCKVCITTARH